ncbi:helix-turn-helix domain-containing protein [Fulvivirga lutea]|uniref:Helix-turn-helix transcriptional regulator n=1 Tax=Fulvivirga lutea TaxID=2810512 RepID=A0A974WJT3_9BACT|nr:helix-turn-helix transcriptional regulator [Fulvivirga lutea]QSE98512.1 helix-turn-helix transcriptional regulator [Fulvivirga lutea]
MKQPELGKKIADLRKEQNLTQDELVEKCNVNVRTLQRIEAGEVTPRPSTLRIIVEALGQDFKQTFGQDDKAGFWQMLFVSQLTENQTKSILQPAWIAGLIYFALGIVEAAASYLLTNDYMSISQQIFVAATKLGVLASYFFFMRGFVALGKLFDNYLLKISSYLMVACYIILIAFDIYHVIAPFDETHYIIIQSTAAVTFGALGIILGVGFIRLRPAAGGIAIVAGIFELIIAVFFLTVVGSFLALLLLIPAVIIEVVILYKMSEQLSVN